MILARGSTESEQGEGDMNYADIYDEVSVNETASIENTGADNLSVSLICNTGCRVVFELVPGQVVELAGGSSGAKIILHHGDPDNLLIIKPESAS
jgi:hypothetical protein